MCYAGTLFVSYQSLGNVRGQSERNVLLTSILFFVFTVAIYTLTTLNIHVLLKIGNSGERF